MIQHAKALAAVLLLIRLLLGCTVVLSVGFVTFSQIHTGNFTSGGPNKSLGEKVFREAQNLLVAVSATATPMITIADSENVLHQDVPPSNMALSPIANPSVPKIEIIAIWDTREGREVSYVPLFFHSVALNPQVKLLLVEIHKGSGCRNRELPGNVKHVCLSLDEYISLHVNYFCQRWKCMAEQSGIVHDFLRTQSYSDWNHSYFRILRSAVFAKYLDPETTIWGWCDFDTYWGNFQRVFPWDIAHNFDIIAVGWQQSPPQTHLFLRGHMSFFRNHPSTLAKLAAYPLYSSFAALKHADFRIDAEESYLSHYIFSENEEFTFLLMGGLPPFRSMAFFSDDGAWTTLKPISWRISNDTNEDGSSEVDERLLPPQTRKRVFELLNARPEPVAPSHLMPPFKTTFSSSPNETTSRIFHHGYNYDDFKWYPDEYITYVETDWTPSEDLEKGYIMRREPGGKVTQRLEPRERFLIRDKGLVVEFDEALYLHFQLDKYRAFFKELYSQGFQGGNLHVHWQQDGGEIWDKEGNIVREAGWRNSH